MKENYKQEQIAVNYTSHNGKAVKYMLGSCT